MTFIGKYCGNCKDYEIPKGGGCSRSPLPPVDIDGVYRSLDQYIPPPPLSALKIWKALSYILQNVQEKQKINLENMLSD